jgi:hypothetical protein
MKKLTRLALAACALGAASCTDNDLSMVITRFVPITEMAQCLVDPAATTTISMGIVDTHIAARAVQYQQEVSGYVVAPVVQNNLIDSSAAAGGTTVQRNAIQITGFDVELHLPTDATGHEMPFPAAVQGRTEFSVPAAGGLITPNAGTAAVKAEVIPASFVAALDGVLKDVTILVHVRAVGQRASGTLRGGWVDFPVKVCSDCLGTPNRADEQCPTGGYDATTVQTTCLPAQDFPTTCCTQNPGQPNARLLCGASVPVVTH